MKPQANDHVAGGKPQTTRRRGVVPKVIPFVAVLVLFTVVSISYPSIRYSQTIVSRLSSDDDGDDPVQPSPAAVNWGGEPPQEAAAAGDSVVDGNSDREDRENISSNIVDINMVTAAVEEGKVQVAPKSNLEIPASLSSEEVNPVAVEEKVVKVAQRKKSRRSRRRSRRRQRRDAALTAPRIVSKTEAPPKVPAARSDGGGGDDDDVKALESEVAYNNEGCNIFSGEWVRDPEGQYYTNLTCDWAIQEHQNCMKFEENLWPSSEIPSPEIICSRYFASSLG
nr:protein trichome birefringence-like 19 [Ipomoea batatas]